MSVSKRYADLGAHIWLRFSQGLAFLSLVLLAHGLSASSAFAETDPPTSAYQHLRVQEFDVFVSPKLDEELAAQVVRALGAQLAMAKSVLPAEAFELLKTTPFWIERERSPSGAVYHPSRAWLLEHGYNPDKAGGIELSHARHFLEWSATDQPMMIPHELSHAYAYKVLGVGYVALNEAYSHAVAAGIYRRVPYVHGGTRRAYALNDKFEYFAELTEAYFGRNDYFPFTRAELETFDPQGFALVRTAWAAPRLMQR